MAQAGSPEVIGDTVDEVGIDDSGTTEAAHENQQPKVKRSASQRSLDPLQYPPTQPFNSATDIASLWTADAEPDGPYTLCVFVGRVPWMSKAHDVQDVFDRCLAQNQHHYLTLLNAPPATHQVPWSKLRGPNEPIRSARLSIARDVWKSVPIHIDDKLEDPALREFVKLFHDVFRPNNPNPPSEIHIVVSGFCGFSVGIEKWGDDTTGFLGWMLAQDATHNTDTVRHVYIVPVIEPHVLDGIAPHSLDYPNPTPGWEDYAHKKLQKVRLLDLVHRNEIMKEMFFRISNDIPLPFPNFYPPRVPLLDCIIKAMKDEYDVRMEMRG